MPVYVDDMSARYRGMIMCHMVADSDAELHAMECRIGVARRHFQGDHYDICLAKRAAAVKAGAIQITKRHAALIVRPRRRGGAKGASTP